MAPALRLALLACLVLALGRVQAIPSPSDKEVRCSACEIVAKKIGKDIDNVDMKETVLLGGRLEGGEARKKVKYARSEAHLMELFEQLCDNLPSYAGTAKTKKKWKFIKDKDKRAWEKEKEYARKNKARDRQFKKYMERKQKKQEQKYRPQEMNKDKADDAEDDMMKMDEEEEEEEELEELGPPPTPTGFSKVVSTGKEHKQLKRSCSKLVDEHEEELTAYLHGNWAEDLELKHKLCVEIAGVCPAKKSKKKPAPKSEL